MYCSVSWLYKGTVPLTVTFERSEPKLGASLVQRITLSLYGSPEATPCVKFNWLSEKVSGETGREYAADAEDDVEDADDTEELEA